MTENDTLPFDPGLQPERTALAWRRTALTFALSPLLAARLLAPQFGLLAAGAALFGLALGTFVGVTSWVRYRALYNSLTTEPVGHRLPGSALLFVTAIVPLVGGLLVLVRILGKWLLAVEGVEGVGVSLAG